MTNAKLWFNKRDTATIIMNQISVEFEIGHKISSLNELEKHICENGNFEVEIRYTDTLSDEVTILLQQILALFDHLKNELGSIRFNYVILPREQVTLDFTKCKYIGEAYLEMRSKMEWDDWYGENLSALWDILTGLPYKGDDFVILRPYMYLDIPYDKNAEFTESINKICDIFREAQDKYEDITVKIQYVDESSNS